jgi:hypothetical protein
VKESDTSESIDLAFQFREATERLAAQTAEYAEQNRCSDAEEALLAEREQQRRRERGCEALDQRHQEQAAQTEEELRWLRKELQGLKSRSPADETVEIDVDALVQENADLRAKIGALERKAAAMAEIVNDHQLALAQRIVDEFKGLAVARISDFIYRAVKDNAHIDVVLQQYCSFRFAIKVIVKPPVVLPGDSQASVQWDEFPGVPAAGAVAPGDRVLPQLFDKQQTGPCPSPNRLPPLPCPVDDVQLQRFFNQAANCRQTKELHHWVTNAFHTLAQSRSTCSAS